MDLINECLVKDLAEFVLKYGKPSSFEWKEAKITFSYRMNADNEIFIDGLAFINPEKKGNNSTA